MECDWCKEIEKMSENIYKEIEKTMSHTTLSVISGALLAMCIELLVAIGLSFEDINTLMRKTYEHYQKKKENLLKKLATKRGKNGQAN